MARQRPRRPVGPRTRDLLAGLVLAVGAAAQGPSVAAKESTVVIIHQRDATEPHRELLARLDDAISKAPRLRALQQLGVVQKIQEDGTTRTDPPHRTLASYASRADHVICVGEVAFRSLLVGPPIANPRTRIHAIGVTGLRWLPTDNAWIPRLHRLDSAVDDHPCLAHSMELALARFEGVRRVGLIVSSGCRPEPVDTLRAAASELGIQLMVESIDDPTEAIAAANRLSARRIELLLQADDPRALAGPRGRLIAPYVRLHMISRSIVVMGLDADEHAHFHAPLDRGKAARDLVAMILAGDEREAADAPRVRCSAARSLEVDPHACRVDGISLR